MKHVKRLDQSILQNDFYQNANADTLAIILPGAGYPVMAPLNYYLTNLFIAKKFDVLNVAYDYRFYPTSENRMSFL